MGTGGVTVREGSDIYQLIAVIPIAAVTALSRSQKDLL
jgi:hypothetical protein